MAQFNFTVLISATMIEDLRSLAIFAKTVELGSFRAAAKALDLSPSVVSHHIAALEKRLGAALLYRSTRRLSLSDEGNVLFASAKTMLEAAEQGLEAIAERANSPSGHFRITLPAFFSRSPLLNDIAEFSWLYPKIKLELNFSDHTRDLIREGIDLAIRVGDLNDSGLKSKKIFDLSRTLVAAPSLMAAHTKPRKPSDLCDWPWVGLKMREHHKIMLHPRLGSSRIDYQPKLIVDQIDAMSQLALLGMGLATPPSFLVEHALREGTLIDPLPRWRAESLGVYALWPANASKQSLPARFLAFLESKKTK